MVMTKGQEAFVRERRLAVLTTLFANGRPQATPVYYVLEDGKFFISSTRDRVKTRNILRNPRVVLCILDEQFLFRYVQVRGTATVTGEDLVERSRRIFLTFRESLADDFPEQLAQQNRIILVLTPERVSPDR